jgi:hypothetical protein
MASYKNESTQTKALKLSRLSKEDMVKLLLNALTECNFHSEVSSLAGKLNAPSDYWMDKKTSNIAETLATKLEWDGHAVARVIANASSDQDIISALKSVGLYGGKLASATKVAMRYLQAGKGLKSVQAVLPGVNDRQANHFLHALAGSIVGGDVVDNNTKLVEGELEVEIESGFHPSSPSYPESDYIKGYNGLTNNMYIEVELRDLERLAKMSLSGLSFDNRQAVESLCDSLTKNIKGNILRNMQGEELDVALGDVQHEIEYKIPEGYVLNHIEVAHYDYKVKNLTLKGKSILVSVTSEVSYDVYVGADEDYWD